MSTHRGLVRNAIPKDRAWFDRVRRQHIRRYRCVYYQEGLADRWGITAHEIQCPMRQPMLRLWARSREKAIRRGMRP